MSARTAESRWVGFAVWAAILAPVPYALSRVLWAAGVPVGIERELLEDFHVPGWGSLYILMLALLSESVGVFVHYFVRRRARRVPDWVPLVGGRRVGRRWVVALLLVPTVVLAWRAVLHLRLVFNGFEVPEDITGVPHWSLWTQAALVWVWSAALATTTVSYARRNPKGA